MELLACCRDIAMGIRVHSYHVVVFRRFTDAASCEGTMLTFCRDAARVEGQDQLLYSFEGTTRPPERRTALRLYENRRTRLSHFQGFNLSACCGSVFTIAAKGTSLDPLETIAVLSKATLLPQTKL